MNTTTVRRIMTGLGVAALVIVIFLNRHELSQFWHVWHLLRWYVIVFIVIIQLASYGLNALYYRSILRLLGHQLPTFRLFEAALAANFVNYVAPTIGLAGAGYISQVLKPEVPRGKSVLLQFLRYGLSTVAVVMMIPVGFIWTALGHDEHRTIAKICLLSGVMVIAFVLLVIFILSREKWLRRQTKMLLRFVRHFRPRTTLVERTENLIDEFYRAYHDIVSRLAELGWPFGWSMLYILVEITTLYLGFVAFGRFVNPGIVIMAYVVANIVSVVGGVLFTTGVFELGLAGTLIVLGQPAGFAIAVTLVYRVLNLLTGLPLGFYFYHKYLPQPKNLVKRLQ